MGYETAMLNMGLFQPNYFGNFFMPYSQMPQYYPSLFAFNNQYNPFNFYQNNLYNNCFNYNPVNYTFNPGFLSPNYSNANSNANYSNNIFRSVSQNNNIQLTESIPVKRDGLGGVVSSTAKSYVGKVNNDAEGNRLFSGGKCQAWCQDFVSSILRKTTKNLPKLMTTTSSPVAFKDKAKEIGCYKSVPTANRTEWASKNIHKGDVLVKKGSGKSGLHVAIVDRVENGKIYATSGNSSNAVKNSTYDIRKGDIYGVVDIQKAEGLTA